MVKKLLLAVLLLALVAPVEAARRWFVQTSDNKIVSFTDDDNAPTPAGTIAVADAVIRTEDPPGATGDITPLGTWDGTATYTAPSGGGIVVPYDPTTDSGQVKDAAHVMMDVFEVALGFIEDNSHVWSVVAVSNAREGIYWMQVNAARIALGTRTAARRSKFMEEAASWPMMVNGDVRQYVDAMGGSGITLPTKDWSWVKPEDDPYTRVDVDGAGTQFGVATNVANAPSSEKSNRKGLDKRHSVVGGTR